MLYKETARNRPTSNILLTFCALVWVLLNTSCVRAPPIEQSMRDRAKPQVGMDPVMELLEFSPESISAAVDSRNLVHVVAADRDNGVIYLVLGRGGIQQREMLLPNWYLGNDLQIAIDDEGIVHAIVGDEHFMRRDGQWHSAGKSPLQETTTGG